MEEGPHTISTEDGFYYPIIVMKSANIETMMVHTDTGKLDYIKESKENSEKGKVVIYDEQGEKEYLGDMDGFRGRGNATWFSDKLAFQITLSRKWIYFKWVLEKDGYS